MHKRKSRDKQINLWPDWYLLVITSSSSIQFWSRFIPVNRGGQIYPTVTVNSPTATCSIHGNLLQTRGCVVSQLAIWLNVILRQWFIPSLDQCFTLRDTLPNWFQLTWTFTLVLNLLRIITVSLWLRLYDTNSHYWTLWTQFQTFQLSRFDSETQSYMFHLTISWFDL